MSGDDPKKIVEFPKAEIVPEERARRLKMEVERLASLPVVERLFYVECEDVAEKHGVSRDVMKAMVKAQIKANENRRCWPDSKSFLSFSIRPSEPASRAVGIGGPSLMTHSLVSCPNNPSPSNPNIRTRKSERGND
jgi:hypothetical protein